MYAVLDENKRVFDAAWGNDQEIKSISTGLIYLIGEYTFIEMTAENSPVKIGQYWKGD